MPRYILLLFIFYSSSSFAQTNLDTLKIDVLLKGISHLKDTNQLIDSKIIQAIQAIDKNINSIVQAKTTYTPKKFTVIESNAITIRRLVERKKAIQIILADSTHAADYYSYWEESGRDTVKFLSSKLLQQEYDLHYPFYQYPEVLTKIDPLEIQSQLHCNNILFYSKQLNLTIDSLSKVIVRKHRPKYYQYLTNNIDYFNANKKRIEPKAIKILTITFGSGNIVYSGVDIYGSHYLLEFDTSNSWHLASIKELWVY